MYSCGCISLMSAPAANALADPVMTMHPQSGSRSSASVAATTSFITRRFSALSAFGRLRVSRAVRPLRSTRTVSWSVVMWCLRSGP